MDEDEPQPDGGRQEDGSSPADEEVVAVGEAGGPAGGGEESADAGDPEDPAVEQDGEPAEEDVEDESGSEGEESGADEPLPEDEGEGDPGDGEASDGGSEAEPLPADDDGIIYTMTGEDPGEDPSDEGGVEGESGESGESDTVPTDEGELVLKPVEEVDAESGGLFDDQVYYATTAAGDFGGRDAEVAAALIDARIAAILAIRSEWSELPPGACMF